MIKRVAGAGLIILLTISVSATPAKGAATDTTLSLEGTQAPPGATVSVAVDLANPGEAVRGLQFTLASNPSILSFVAVYTADRSQGFNADASQQRDGTIRVVLVSLGDGTIAPGSGPVLSLHLAVPPAAPAGVITLTPTDVRVAGMTGEALVTTGRGANVVIGESPPSSSGGGGGGGGCTISKVPQQPMTCWPLLFWLVLPMVRIRASLGQCAGDPRHTRGQRRNRRLDRG